MTGSAERGFAREIVAWQRIAGRHDLPWQASRDPYPVWVSEIMLQQTQVATVIPYFARFLSAFPTLRELAGAPLEQVLRLWSGLGYYSRARHLHACARILVREHHGEFPRSLDALQALPGIGRSTAAAIAVFAFGARAAILDGNVKRVLARAFAVEGVPGQARVDAELWRLAESLLPERNVARYSQGLMDLGATVCTTRHPDCAGCPVAQRCVARREDRIALLPARRARRALPERRATLLLLHCAGEILLEKREPTGIWGGLWSLPQWPGGGAIAEVRSRAAEYGAIGALVGLAPLSHSFSHYRLEADVYGVDLQRRRTRHERQHELWIDLADAQGAALPTPIKRLLTGLHRVSPWHGTTPGAEDSLRAARSR